MKVLMRHLLCAAVSIAIVVAAGAHELTVSGTRFQLDGKPFPYTGVSFFNAIYNPNFNASSEGRVVWIRKFQSFGINVLRVWCQWDIYLRQGGIATVHLAVGNCSVERFNPRAGRSVKLATATGGGVWITPAVPDTENWVFCHEHEAMRIVRFPGPTHSGHGWTECESRRCIGTRTGSDP